MAGEELSGHLIKGGKGFAEQGPALVRAAKELRYVSLHHHTTFSYQDGYGMPESHVRRAVELGMPALAITDHGNVSGHVKLEKAGAKHGVKPIFGCELYTGDVDPERRSQRKNHLTVLARNEEGYRNLLRVVSRSYEDFHYEPTVAGHVLAQWRSGLYILSGCQGSLLATSLVGGKNIAEADASYARAKKVAQRMKRAFGDSFFLEVQMFPQLEKCCEINKAYERLSRELKIPLVATGDVHYTQPSEAEMQVILHSVRGGGRTSFEEQARSWGYDVPLCPPLTDKEVLFRLTLSGLSMRAAKQALDNTHLIAQDCNVVLPKLPQVRYPVPSGYKDINDVWRSWLAEGWKYRNIAARPDWRQYKDRLLYEMSIIEQKNFVDYFLVVSDAVKWAKDSGIPVGPARGSAAASLVCYLLRITEVDPMVWPNLVFERFIDLTREDLPDIDLDFDDERRDEVRSYLVGKYGLDRVANIGTFTAYKAKNSLDDVARVYRIPKFAVEELKGYMIERTLGDLRADSTIEDTAAMFPKAAAIFEKYPDLKQAMRLEGNLRGMGVHAAGLVISTEPITDVCAMYSRTKDGKTSTVISLDKYDAEYLNLLKVDFLGLSTMGFFHQALEWLGMTLEDLYNLPLDDPQVYDAFCKGDVTGIFQWDGRATRNVNMEVQPRKFMDLADINALSRPGPLHGGGTGQYIDAKKGRKAVRKLHPVLDDITSHTYGTIVYQEQILRIVREIGGFDWTHASYIRRIISKKLGEQEFNRQWETFRNGAVANGLPEQDARTIWNEIITAGAYAFNCAHSVSYAMIAYWCMWLKIHHPEVFYAAALRRLPDTKQADLLRDAERHGVIIFPPDVTSEMSWTPNKAFGAVQAGLTQIPGIAEKSAPQIMAAVADGTVAKWDDLTKLRGWGPTKVKNITDWIEQDDPFGIHVIDNKIAKVRSQVKSGKYGWRVPRPTHTGEQIPYSRGKNTQVVWMGVVSSRNLRDIFELHFSRKGTELDPTTVSQPELKEYVTMVARDETETVALTISRTDYPDFKEAIWGLKLDDDVVLVRGYKRGAESRRAIYVTSMWVFGEDD